MINCPYCGRPAILDRVKYGSFYEFYWICVPCDAKIKANPHTKQPLGTMANKELRSKRMLAHRVFDVTWKFTNNRSEAYMKLAEHLNLPPSECHIAKFNIARCNQVITYCRG